MNETTEKIETNNDRFPLKLGENNVLFTFIVVISTKCVFLAQRSS